MADPVPSVAVAAGSYTVTGTATSFIAAENDLFCARGLIVPIAARPSPTTLTLKQPWPGATFSGETAFSILSLGEYWRSAIPFNKRLVELLAKWEVVSPFKFDVAGALSGRDAYNNQPAGFIYVAIDQRPARIYLKTANTNSSLDWSAPILLGYEGVEADFATVSRTEFSFDRGNAAVGQTQFKVASFTAGLETVILNGATLPPSMYSLLGSGATRDTIVIDPLQSTDNLVIISSRLGGVRDAVTNSALQAAIPTASTLVGTSATGRSLMSGTAAQGATALGLGTGNQPLFAGIRIGPGGAFTPGSIYSDANWGFLHYPRVAAVAAAHAFFNAAGTAALLAVQDGGNVGIGVAAPGTKLDVGGPIRAGSYTVATLPAGVTGALVFVSNARKAGEAAGAGTGVAAVYSNGNWRRLSDDSPVAG